MLTKIVEFLRIPEYFRAILLVAITTAYITWWFSQILVSVQKNSVIIEEDHQRLILHESQAYDRDLNAQILSEKVKDMSEIHRITLNSLRAEHQKCVKIMESITTRLEKLESLELKEHHMILKGQN